MKLTQENYVDRAEEIIKKLGGKTGNKRGPQMVTTSKLRRLLSMTMDIYSQVLTERSEELNDEIRGRIEYLRVRMIYEAGRDKDVKLFLDKAGLIDYLKEAVKTRSQYLLFVRYMEALVAFRKYYYKGDREL